MALPSVLLVHLEDEVKPTAEEPHAPFMADKPRKRKPNASCSEDTSKEYHAVDISDPTTAAADARWRRRSAGNSNSSNGSSSTSGSRSESWMNKVTSAMSQRIFSGKKLGASRSTQVMPLAAASSAEASSVSGTPAPATTQEQQHNLRQVSSEYSFTRALVESVASELVLLTPAENVAFGSSVVCDIAVDNDNGHEDPDHDNEPCRARRTSPPRQDTEAKPSVLRSIHVRGKATSRAQSSVIEKVAPSDQENSDDEDGTDHRRASRRASHTEFSTRDSDSDGRHDEDNKDGRVLQDPAPILKDFFTRNASIGQGLRVQQRESRREAVYKTSFQRQERLRRRVEAESRELETQQRRLRAEQLQRATHQRRVRVRREAAAAHQLLASRRERDTNSFVRERERWEGEFEDEMRLLSRAFRKASATTACSDRSSGDDSCSLRPTTVAGLAVPQALAQIRREASNYEKRLKTARPHRDWEWDSTCSHPGADGRSRRWNTGSDQVDSFQIDSVRRSGDESATDDRDDYTAQLLVCSSHSGNDDDAAAVEFGFVPCDSVERGPDDARALMIEKLLDERQRLLERIAQLERLVVTSSTVT